MSVTIDHPASGRLGPADGEPTAAGLRLEVRGRGPRSTPIFVNEETLTTDPEGRFAVTITLPPGEGWLIAGLLTGCARVTARLPVDVRLG